MSFVPPDEFKRTAQAPLEGRVARRQRKMRTPILDAPCELFSGKSDDRLNVRIRVLVS
ncbi:MAG: hypothetical protein JRC77_11595 [Deltaproteobacteria bacterium]|nr:hypothetical protein [Deltaproteobacteria bacterium]